MSTTGAGRLDWPQGPTAGADHRDRGGSQAGSYGQPTGREGGTTAKAVARLPSAMETSVKLGDLETVLADLEYPVDRERAVDALDDVTLRLADGEIGLGDVVADSSEDRFESMDDLGGEVRNLLPRRAVGEPYQSEGEG